MLKKFILFGSLTASLAGSAVAQSWTLAGNSDATATSKLGTTTAIPLNITTNNTTRIFVANNGRIGIGTVLPQNILTVQTSGGTPSSKWAIGGTPTFAGFAESGIGNSDFVLSMASSTFNARPVYIGRRSRGTLAAPTAVVNNDYLMSFLGTGYDGTNFQNSAALDVFVDGTPTPGNVPARISLVTGTNGSNRTERLKVGSTGNIFFNNTQLTITNATGRVGIGTASPAAKLDLLGNIRIADGTQAAGRVLTSDANGIASWSSSGLLPAGVAGQTLRYNGTTWVANSALTNTGSAVGIGTANPMGALHVDQPFNFAGVNFTGTGLNDLTVDVSGYTGSGVTNYAIRIQNSGPNPNMIEVSSDSGVTWAAPQPIANPIVLTNGVTASFDTTAGHTFGDLWRWSVNKGYYNTLLVKDGKIGIGTTTPAKMLDVAGQVRIYYDEPSNSGYSLTPFLIENSSAPGRYPALTFYSGYLQDYTQLYGRGANGGLLVYGATGFQPVAASAFNVNSDITLKKDITHIKSHEDYEKYLKQIREIDAITYRYKNEVAKAEEKTKTTTVREELHVGFSAQSLPAEIQVKLPLEPSVKSEMKLGYNLSDMAGLTLIGVKALDAKTESLAKENEELKKANEELKSKVEKQQAQIDAILAKINDVESAQVACCNAMSSRPVVNSQSTNLTSASLDQNIPNPPVNNATKIGYNIPVGAGHAEMLITDNYGKKVKQINLAGKGKGFLDVNTAGLAPGSYSYTLYVDGKMIETKSMIVGGK